MPTINNLQFIGTLVSVNGLYFHPFYFFSFGLHIAICRNTAIVVDKPLLRLRIVYDSNIIAELINIS